MSRSYTRRKTVQGDGLLWSFEIIHTTIGATPDWLRKQHVCFDWLGRVAWICFGGKKGKPTFSSKKKKKSLRNALRANWRLFCLSDNHVQTSWRTQTKG